MSGLRDMQPCGCCARQCTGWPGRLPPRLCSLPGCALVAPPGASPGPACRYALNTVGAAARIFTSIQEQAGPAMLRGAIISEHGPQCRCAQLLCKVPPAGPQCCARWQAAGAARYVGV